jgi:hypothetical protein
MVRWTLGLEWVLVITIFAKRDESVNVSIAWSLSHIYMRL